MYKKRNLILSLAWIVIGSALIVLSACGVLDSSLYCGFGGGLLAVGIAQIVRYVKYHTNDSYREKVDTQFSDERIRYISMKAWSWSAWTAVVVCGLAAVVCVVLDLQGSATILGYIVCGLLLLYWVFYLYLSKKD